MLLFAHCALLEPLLVVDGDATDAQHRAAAAAAQSTQSVTMRGEANIFLYCVKMWNAT